MNQKSLIVILGVVVVFLAGTTVYLVTINNTSQSVPASRVAQQAMPTPAVQTTIPATQPIVQPQDIIEKIKSNWESKYTLLNIDENNHPEINELSIRLYEGGPVYKVDGFNFYADYDGGVSLDVMPHDPNPTDYGVPKTADTVLRKEIASIYKDFGLLKTETRGDKNNSTDTDIYTGKGLICTIQTPTSGTSANNAQCGLIDAYKEMAEKIKPLADVIPNMNASSTVFSNLKITNSSVNGYQNASVGVGNINGGGGVALLYKKDSSSWMYFTTTQEMLPCSGYNTIDIRNAFKGESCYGASGQTAMVQ